MIKRKSKFYECSHNNFHIILSLFDGSANFLFITSEMKRGYP